MAGFTEELSPPERQAAPFLYGGSGKDTAAGAIGEGLSGAADIAKIGLGAMLESKGREITGTVSNSLDSLAQQYAGQSQKGTPLIGEQPQDTAGKLAAQSPIVQSTTARLGELGQAQAQGGMSEMEFFTRANAQVQDAVNRNPFFASEIRAAAKDVLGYSPSEKMIALQAQDEETSKAIAKQATATQVDAAAKAGFAFYKDDGSLDLDKMQQAGASWLQSDTQMDRALKQSQLDTANAKAPLSRDEQMDAMTVSVRKITDPLMDSMMDGVLSGIPAQVAKLQGEGKDQQVADVLTGLGVQQARFHLAFNQFILKHPEIAPDVADRVWKEYDDSFEAVKTMAGAGLDNLSQLDAAWKRSTARTNFSFAQSAPTLAALVKVSSSQGAAAIISGVVSQDSKLEGQLAIEAKGWVAGAGKTDPMHIVNTAVGAISGPPGPQGNYDLSNEQNPVNQSGVIKGLASYLSTTNNQVGPLKDSDSKAWGSAAAQIAAVAQKGQTFEDTSRGLSLIDTPTSNRRFLEYVSNKANAQDAPLVAAHVEAANVNFLINPALAPRELTRKTDIPVDTKVNLGLPGNAGLAARAGTSGVGLNYTAHVSAVYNPISGHLEPSYTVTDARGNTVNLPPAQTAGILAQATDFMRSLKSANQAIDTATLASAHTGGPESRFKPEEYRQALIDRMGIKLKEGTAPVPMPNWLTQASAGPSGKSADKIAAVESSGNPSAKNSRSSATGLDQFTKSTWLDVMKKNFASDIKGMTDQAILKLRSNADWSKKATEAYAKQNYTSLENVGIKNPGDIELAIAHRFGARGAKAILTAPMTSPIESLVSPEVMKENPDLVGKTPRDIYNELEQKMGG